MIFHLYTVGPDAPEAATGVWASAGEAAEVSKASHRANDCGCHGQHFSVYAATVKCYLWRRYGVDPGHS